MAEKKKYKSYRELYSDWAPKSYCSTVITGDTTNPDRVHICFKGPVANVPALKNQKMKDTNVLRPEAKVKFDIMTRAFQKSCNFSPPRFTPKTEVFCLVLCSYRGVSFDEDNVLTSVRDWLEPSHLRKSNRGWGVGIVDNDKQVSAYAIKKRKNSLDPDVTEIHLRKLDDVRDVRDEFLSFVIGEDISKLY